jgi:hypothetical protein
MGSSISWIGVKGRGKGEVLDALGLEDTDAPVGDRVTRFSLATMPGEWLIVMANNMDFASPARLASLSAGAEVLGVQVEEHVMFSGLRVYHEGAEVWSVIHDCNHGLDHAAVTGTPPALLQPIIDDLRTQQAAEGGDDAEVDLVFDVPVVAAAAICGYRHDGAGDEGAPEPVFTELRPSGSVKTSGGATASSGGGFFSQLFGRR